MSLFAKVDPMESRFTFGETAEMRVGVKGSDAPLPGDELIIWASESHGGSGLSAIGIVTDASVRPFSNDRNAGEHDEFVIRAVITANGPRLVTKTDAQPFRDVRDGSPMSVVSQIAYYQSHRKCKRIDEKTARFLRLRFVERS